MSVVQDFILQNIYSTLDEILSERLFKDFKTLLQEYTQEHFDITPHYVVIDENGPDHDKTYIVEVYISEKHLGT